MHAKVTGNGRVGASGDADPSIKRFLDAVWMDGQLVVHQQQFKNPEAARVLAEVAARAGVWQTKVVKILSASASPALLA